MNWRLVVRLLRRVLVCQAFFILLPLLVALIYGEDYAPFTKTMAVLLMCAGVLGLVKAEEAQFRVRDGLVSVALSWLALSVFGALPYYLSGFWHGYLNALFESVSGFTTTGATVLDDIERVPHGLLLWRSFTQWIGGMGVLVFVVAMAQGRGGASVVNVVRAESTGPTQVKIVPKIRDMAKILYFIYMGLTVLNVAALKAAGLDWFNAWIHAFSTAGTGGFSSLNDSIGGFKNVYVESVTTFFMLIFGINFSLFFLLLRKAWRVVLKNEELRLYGLVVLFGTIGVTLNIAELHGSVLESARHALFQVASIITSTGFVSTNYGHWQTASQVILLALMISGACAGGTSGGIKLIRLLVLVKSVRIEMQKLIHPRITNAVKLNGKLVEGVVLVKIFMFIFVYCLFLLLGALLVSLDVFDIETTLTAVMASLSNAGVGLGGIGALGGFGFFSPLSKIVLMICMLAGRLEFFSVMLLFMPSVWVRASK